MKIKSLQISNILTFKYVDDIEKAEKIIFDKDFNILIGQNGAGKSTVLEVINFIFKRVLFVPYTTNQDLYFRRIKVNNDERKQVLSKIHELSNYMNFRLDKNYDFEGKEQKIRIEVEIDDIDRANVKLLKENKEKLAKSFALYTVDPIFSEEDCLSEYKIDIELRNNDKSFTVSSTVDMGFNYLQGYNLYKEIINIHNRENGADRISSLAEPFTLVGGYRNYSSFSDAVSLAGSNKAEILMEAERAREYSKSTNSIENNEPSIFGLVRLRMASKCLELITGRKDQKECEVEANTLPFVLLINERIKIVNVKVEIKLLDVPSWNFTFSLRDIIRDKIITDINSLSAGQKAIIHLVFEAYGRGDLKGGLVIIDEPEIHLHYQFQSEYLKVIEELNKEQECQYILVTHSESLISSETIKNVLRVSLDKHGYTKINRPTITTLQKWLVKILDNKRSTCAFFGSKVLLVEGETDRYFYRAVLGELGEEQKKGITQDITVIDINDKDAYKEWKSMFESFGLKVFYINDLDFAFRYYPLEKATKINTSQGVSDFRGKHPDVDAKIDDQYKSNIFTLREGDLEIYLLLRKKGIQHVVEFCKNKLHNYLNSVSDVKMKEIRNILDIIIKK